MVNVYGFICGVLLGVLFWLGYASCGWPGVLNIYIISIIALCAAGCVVAAIDEHEHERWNNG